VSAASQLFKGSNTIFTSSFPHFFLSIFFSFSLHNLMFVEFFEREGGGGVLLWGSFIFCYWLSFLNFV